jgi:hypothetical protein
MNSEAEMREVMLHAAEKLSAAKDATIRCDINHMNHNGPKYLMPKEVLVAVSYAEAVLRLLASYLKVDPDQRATATPEPGWTGQEPNGHRSGGQPTEKVERNAAVVAAVNAGEPRKDVAARFGISERRVSQIVDAHLARQAAEATP